MSRGDYVGCGLWAAGFLVLVAISFTVGIILRPDRDVSSEPGAVTLGVSGSGDARYRLIGRIDETNAPCVALVREGAEEVGQCGLTNRGATGEDEERFTVTSAELPDGTTVVFGPLPRQAESVRLELADDSRPTIEARRSQSAGLSWFVHETDQQVTGPPVMLDGNGEPVPIP